MLNFLKKAKKKIAAIAVGASLTAITAISACAEPLTVDSAEVINEIMSSIVGQCMSMAQNVIIAVVPLVALFIGWKLAKGTVNTVTKPA